MFNKRNLIVISVIIVLFAVGLVGFFIFSAPYGDGLERTMEDADVEGGEPVYSAPLDYGDNYPLAFFMGCMGFAATLLCVYLIGRFMEKKDAPQHS